MPSTGKLVVVDALAYAYRSFYAIRELTHSSGKPLNAVYGFVMALQKAIKDFKPDYAVVAFDAPGPTFRDALLKEYKTHRQPMPEPLAGQLQEIKELVPLFGWTLLSAPGFEADDIMGTLAKMAMKAKVETVLLTSDKDMLQLVGDTVKVYRENPMGGSLYGAAEVRGRYGIGPEHITDLLGLMGDSSDNIPGVPGIGEKTAASLLNEYGSLEAILKAAPGIAKAQLSKNLQEFADQARASQVLATLNLEVPVPKFDTLKFRGPDYSRLLPRLKDLEFRKLHADLSLKSGSVEITTEAPTKPVAKKKQVIRKLELLQAGSAAELAQILKKKPFDLSKTLGVLPFPDSGEPRSLTLAQEGTALVLQCSEGAAGWAQALQPFKKLILFRSKPLHLALLKSDQAVQGRLLDVELASYLLNPGRPWRDLGEAASGLGMDLPDFVALQDDLAGPEPSHLARHAQALSEMSDVLSEKLSEGGVAELYDELEEALVRVLAKMECSGVKMDLKVLEELEEVAQKSLATLKKKAVALAGSDFNLNSPSQLADILFNQLKLPVQRKNKTGPSTDTDVLEALSDMHELPGILLQHRVLAKLSNTYLQALPKLVDPKDERLHTSWNQSVAATGRLSSTDPNLQNIPIRTDLGRQIRRAFIPDRKGDLILTADYSQIELRILAHYSGDEALVETFRKDEDIHAQTAAKVFSLPLAKVTEDMRRRSKVINFGILYGMSPFGLSRELGIRQDEARSFIENYFNQFPKVSAFLESCRQQARDKGYVSTLMGRRRSIPEIHSANRNLREFAERTAINTPIQGSAADLIKKAMLAVDAMLVKKKARSRLILQVHDELVFELAKEEAAWLPGEVQKIMENSMKLAVPLKVSLGKGKNWYEAGH